MKKIIISIIFFTVTYLSYTQDYSTAIGFRGGLSSGITVKHFIKQKANIEVILAGRWKGFYLVGLYEFHAQAFDVPRLYWYYGGGVHIGSWKGNEENPWFNDNESHTVIGVDGILSLEYELKKIPINISFDLKPSFNFIGNSNPWIDEFGLSVRYMFLKKKYS